jgi:phage replication O-like protein O
MKEHPDLSNGYTKIANEIVEALARTYLTSYETRVLYAILRKTYGWEKKEDWISISQFVEITGLHRSHISRSLLLLSLRNIITKRGNKISFNKYWSQWKELPNGVTNHSLGKRKPKNNILLPNGVSERITKRGIGELPNGAYTKETPTKETITKVIGASPQEYGNADVNAILATVKRATGLTALDGTIQGNRNAASNAIKKLTANAGSRERAVVLLIHAIEKAAIDPFHSRHMTGCRYIEQHCVKLIVQFPLPA